MLLQCVEDALLLAIARAGGEKHLPVWAESLAQAVAKRKGRFGRGHVVFEIAHYGNTLRTQGQPSAGHLPRSARQQRQTGASRFE